MTPINTHGLYIYTAPRCVLSGTLPLVDFLYFTMGVSHTVARFYIGLTHLCYKQPYGVNREESMDAE